MLQAANELPAVDTLPRHDADILTIRHLRWPDEAACAASARGLARHAGVRRAFIELVGPLGAGKTAFARHLLRALGVGGRIKSPSYALLEPYVLPAPDGGPGTAASHLDFYRFDDAREWEDAGLRDVFGAPGLKLVEWPEKAAALLPRPDLRLLIEPAQGDARQVTMQALTPLGTELLA